MRNIPRLYLDINLLEGINLTLNDKDFHYLAHVLKKRENDEIILVNGKDGEFTAIITIITNKKIEVKVNKKTKNFIKPNFLGLIFSPIEKMDLLAKNATELGVTDFYPVITQNTIKAKEKLKRIIPNIKEAVEQSERLDFPMVHNISTVEKILMQTEKDDLIFFCEERSKENSIKDILKIDFKNKKRFFALVGPEGGFSEKEKNEIKRYQQVQSVNLGDNILRTETAVSSILTILKILK